MSGSRVAGPAGLLAVAVAAGVWAGPGPNLLRNPGFEEGSRQWSTQGHAWFEQPQGSGLGRWAVDDSVVHAGKRSLCLTGSDNRGLALQEVSAVPGADYVASGWVRTRGLGQAEAAFDVGFIGDAGRWLGGEAPKALTGDQEWTPLSCSFTAPAGTRSLRMHLFTRSANRGTVWFDDLRLVRLLPPSPVSCLRVTRAGAGLALDWSAYKGEAKSFRVYQSEAPFAAVRDGHCIAEVDASVRRYSVDAPPSAFFAVTAVDGSGREGSEVGSLSSWSERPSDPVAPDCLWADTFPSETQVFLASGIDVEGGSARLSAQSTREWIPAVDAQRVKREGGWPASGSCAVAGASLTLTFRGNRLLGYGPSSSDMGLVEVAVDGGPGREVDLFGDWAPARQVLLASGLTDGPHTAVIRTTGKKSARGTAATARFDVFEAVSEGIPTAGTLLSRAIACSPDAACRWLRLRYAAAVPPGAAIRIDVLDGAGKVLLANAPDGADLSGLRSPVLQLRATLRPGSGQSPLLAFWQVEYQQRAPEKARWGTVLDALTGKPVPGARVMVSLPRQAARRLTTRRDGHFALPGSATGGAVTATAAGYLESARRWAPMDPQAPLALVLYPAKVLAAQRLQAWPVSPMRNVFQDAVPARAGAPLLRLEAAANEVEPAQLALRAEAPMGKVRLGLTPLQRVGGGCTIAARRLRARFVGYVPVVMNSPDVPEGFLARQAPGYYPDPLLTVGARELAPGRTQPVWLSVAVPADALAGDYTGDLRIETAYGVLPVPVKLTVWPFRLTDETHLWFGHGGSGWGELERHYTRTGSQWERDGIIRMALRDRAAHRENVIYLDHSVFDLCRITAAADGGWRYDFAALDRWIDAVRAAYPHGRYLIEGGCFASRDGWTASEILFNGCPVYDEKGSQDAARSLPRISTDSEQFRSFARPFFTALEAHLAKRGELERFYTRLQDEPLESCRPAYLRLAALVHEAAPRLRRFEAIQTTGLADSLEIQDAQLDWFDRNREHYFSTRRPGCQVWFYTCWMPRGKYPSRLIDYPLTSHRIIPWMVRRVKADGYDRYGWACWYSDAMQAYDYSSPLCPGDNFAVYPDPNRREIIGSLRWEMMREGMEDNEYLWLLGQRLAQVGRRLGARPGEFDPEARAAELAAQAVVSCTDYERDPVRLADLRRRVAREIVGAEAHPQALLATDPTCADPVRPGKVRVRGITEKGAVVSLNGKRLPVRADGRFEGTFALSPGSGRLVLKVSHASATRVMTRTFGVAMPSAP